MRGGRRKLHRGLTQLLLLLLDPLLLLLLLMLPEVRVGMILTHRLFRCQRHRVVRRRVARARDLRRGREDVGGQGMRQLLGVMLGREAPCREESHWVLHVRRGSCERPVDR